MGDREGSAASIESVYRAVRTAAGTTAPTPAAPAVAVVAWRKTEAGGIEVFLVERAEVLRFLGGYWCFPGGRIDPSDADPESAARRELREEVGVDLPPGRMRPVARYITPDYWPARFEATYFLAELGQGDRPDAGHSGGELKGGVWVTPGDALERFARGEWLMPTPVARTLDALRPGIAGAQGRLGTAAVDDAAEVRMWPLAAGVDLVLLATPTLPPAAHTGCYLIGDGELVAIDPGSPWPEEQAILAERIDRLAAAGRRLVAVLLTHHHGDHVGGASALARRAGVPIWAHAETARRLAGHIAVDRHLADGEVIALRGPRQRRLRAIFTPGHAPGHLCFLEEETGFLVAGDMVASVGTILIHPSEGDMTEYLASLARLRQLSPRALLPAHGAPIADPAAKLDEYIGHRMWREQRVIEALARGPGTARELVPVAYHDTPAALHGLAERSLLAHLAKLLRDGRARCDGELWSQS